jgi:NADPH-dependent ferric siderophore reductase
VLATRLTSPHLQRITFGGPELAAFLQTDGIDTPAAWVKIFLPSGESRAYTIRSVDYSAGTMDIEFVLHTAHGASGPAATWAAQAQAGEQVVIAGPREGGYALSDGASWLLLAGDLTAMPAIQRIAATLPPACRPRSTSNWHRPTTASHRQHGLAECALAYRWRHTRQRTVPVAVESPVAARSRLYLDRRRIGQHPQPAQPLPANAVAGRQTRQRQRLLESRRSSAPRCCAGCC